MARTILEIAREAAERDATAAPPAKLFGTNNKIARILRTAAKDTLREIMAKGGWQGLSELHSTWTFSTIPGVYAYPLPPDWLRAIPRTEQRNGWPLGLCGPASPATWAGWLSGVAAVTAPMGWRIRNNTIFMEPPPAGVELVSMDYISRFPVVSDMAESDVDKTAKPMKVNAPLVWRDGYMNIVAPEKVLHNPEEAGKYETDPGWDDAIWGDSVWSELRRVLPTSEYLPKIQVRRPEFTADTDLPAFDDDFLLSMGMTFRLRRSLGLAYGEQAAEYEEQLDNKLNTDAGNSASFTIGGGHGGADVLPLGGGRWMVS